LAIPNFAKKMTDVAMIDAPAYDVDVRGANVARNNAEFLRLGLTPDVELPIAKPKPAPAKKPKEKAAAAPRRESAPRSSKTAAAAAVPKPKHGETRKRGRDESALGEARLTIQNMGSRRLTAVAGERPDRCMSSPCPCHTASGGACLHLVVTACVRKLLWAARRHGFPWAFTALSEAACMQA
jgi:hypothetical protein